MALPWAWGSSLTRCSGVSASMNSPLTWHRRVMSVGWPTSETPGNWITTSEQALRCGSHWNLMVQRSAYLEWKNGFSLVLGTLTSALWNSARAATKNLVDSDARITTPPRVAWRADHA